MKRNVMIAALMLLLAPTASALIVSVDGQGEIPAEGLELTVTEAEVDPFTEEIVMGLEGNLLCSTPLTVTITRSEKDLVDEFCCAGQCTFGSGELQDTLYFVPNGMAGWYVHFMPQPNTNATVTYLFSGDDEERALTVHYIYNAEGVENIKADKHTKGVYSLTGTLLNSESDITSLPGGVYIQDGKTIIKTK